MKRVKKKVDEKGKLTQSLSLNDVLLQTRKCHYDTSQLEERKGAGRRSCKQASDIQKPLLDPSEGCGERGKCFRLLRRAGKYPVVICPVNYGFYLKG